MGIGNICAPLQVHPGCPDWDLTLPNINSRPPKSITQDKDPYPSPLPGRVDTVSNYEVTFTCVNDRDGNLVSPLPSPTPRLAFVAGKTRKLNLHVHSKYDEHDDMEILLNGPRENSDAGAWRWWLLCYRHSQYCVDELPPLCAPGY